MKKLLSFMMAATMMASLVACGSSSSSSTETTTAEASAESSAEETTASEEASDEETTAEAASSDLTFKIGGSGPLTGGAANYGIAVDRGGQIAVDEINEAGGINGYQVEWLFEDDEHDPERAVNAYNTLKDEGLQIMVGTVTSGPCLAVVEETADDNMFQITPSGSTQDITANDNVFRMCFSDPAQGAKSAQYIGEHDLATSVGVIYDSSDPYSQGIYESFAEAAPDYGIEIVAAEAFTADSRTDFRTQLQTIRDAGATLVFLPFYYTEAALVLQQADEMGYDPTFFGCDGMDGILAVEGFDTSLAEGLMLLTPFAADADDELTQNFVAKYDDLYGEVPIQFAADGYDCVYAIKAACEVADVTPDMSISDICDALVEAMPTISIEGLTGAGAPISFTADGEPNKDPMAVVIQDGVYVAAE